jgi:hypothetical protein
MAQDHICERPFCSQLTDAQALTFVNGNKFFLSEEASTPPTLEMRKAGQVPVSLLRKPKKVMIFMPKEQKFGKFEND